MAHPYHHALSSAGARAEGPKITSRSTTGSTRARRTCQTFATGRLRHHAEGIFLCERVFGTTITNSDGRAVPVRWVGEQHVKEDLGRIPTACDWLRAIKPEAWMMRAGRLPDVGAGSGAEPETRGERDD